MATLEQFKKEFTYPSILYYKGQEITYLNKLFQVNPEAITSNNEPFYFDSLLEAKNFIDKLYIQGDISFTYWDFHGIIIYLTDEGKYQPEITMTQVFNSVEEAMELIIQEFPLIYNKSLE